MRKNAPRKWLHAILDLLPVILIPVFMIYSHRHTIDSGSIQVPQNQIVDFNQLSIINEFEYTNVNESETFDLNTDIKFYENNIYLLQVTQSNTFTNAGRNIPILNDSGTWYNFADIASYLDGNYTLLGNNDVNLQAGNYYAIFKINEEHSGLLFYWVTTADIENQYYHLNLYNLTQMFGSGNEPTYSQFLSYYPLKDYAYTLSHKELVKGTSTITYDDTDIMSQSMYQLYNSVDKYFNMNNVFNMNAVYDWFVLNIFNGNAPLIMSIVWNIALYELVMDLMFLLYALFMWFVDWCISLIERTYDVGRGK